MKKSNEFIITINEINKLNKKLDNNEICKEEALNEVISILKSYFLHKNKNNYIKEEKEIFLSMGYTAKIKLHKLKKAQLSYEINQLSKSLITS